MNRIDCEIIQDLLPLYAEGMVSEKSKEAIEEHIQGCEVCEGLLKGFKEAVLVVHHTEQVEGLKAFRTNMKKHTATVITMSVFATIWVIILAWGLFFLKPGEEMGYCILTFYMILPVTSFVCSVIAGMQKGWMKWLVPVLFGLAGCLLPLPIFGGGMDGISLFFAGIPSIFGLLSGIAIKWAIKSTKK